MCFFLKTPLNSRETLNLKSLCDFCFPEGKVPQKVLKRPRRRTKEGMTPSRLAMMAVNFFGRGKDKKSEDSPQSDHVSTDDEGLSHSAIESSPDETELTFGPASSLPSPRAHQHRPDRPQKHHKAPPDLSLRSIVPPDSHRQPENSFVFLITGHTHLKYGICAFKDVAVKQVC